MAPPRTQLKDKLLRTVAPVHLISLAVYQWILTLIDIVTVQHEPRVLLQPSKLRERAFGRFWMAYGEFLSEGIADQTTANLSTVSGVVLDVGPGSGEQLCHLDPAKISRIYGAEPAAELHGKLRKNAERAGFGGDYRVLHCGAQPESLIPALADAGLFRNGSEGIFDTICCIRVLCGVPRPEETVRGLYKLLKPGGRLVTHEHVVNPWREKGGNVVARILQTVYSFAGWDFFIQCRIDQDTRDILLNAGGKDGWSKVELKYSEPWSPLPNIMAILTKKE